MHPMATAENWTTMGPMRSTNQNQAETTLDSAKVQEGAERNKMHSNRHFPSRPWLLLQQLWLVLKRIFSGPLIAQLNRFFFINKWLQRIPQCHNLVLMGCGVGRELCACLSSRQGPSLDTRVPLLAVFVAWKQRQNEEIILWHISYRLLQESLIRENIGECVCMCVRTVHASNTLLPRYRLNCHSIACSFSSLGNVKLE